MKRLIRILSSRLFWVVILFALQAGLVVYLVFWASFSRGIYLVFMALSMVMAVVLMTRDEKAPYKLMWMFLLVIFPFFGGVFYILFGNKKIGRFSRKRLRAFIKSVPEIPSNIAQTEESQEIFGDFIKEARFITETTGFKAWGGTECEYFEYPEDFYEDLIEELNRAKKFIFIEYFIIAPGSRWNQILEILKRKVREGLDIRVIYDDMGSINVLPSDYADTLKRMGIDAISFNKVHLHINPRLNFRDHRKILSIDGDICYTGGLNLADEYFNDKIRFGHWKDDAIKLRGSACWNLTMLFLMNWDCWTGKSDELTHFVPLKEYKTDGYVQPFGSSPFSRNSSAEEGYLQLINNASKYIWITTPYLIPDDTMMTALRTASLSGVDVRIITPHYPDKRSVFEVTQSNYLELLNAGVKIYEYTPGFIHSKEFLVDDEVCCIGTTNLDYRSFFLHFELSVLFYNSSILSKVKKEFDKTFELSHQVNIEEVKNVPVHKRILRFFFKFFSTAL